MAEPTGRSRSDFLIAAGLGTVFLVVYVSAFGVNRRNMLWFNFVFDADPGRILNDVVRGQNLAVFERHPLFALIVGTMSRGLGAVVEIHSAVLYATGALASAGVGACFIAFRRVSDRVDALLFTLLYACSSAVLVLASIPETFAITSAVIVGTFLFQQPEVAEPSRHRWYFMANMVFAALAIGIAVPNLVYVFLGYANNLRGSDAPIGLRIRRMSAFVGATMLCFLILGAGQRVVYPDVAQWQVGATPVAAVLRDPALQIDRRFSAADLARNVRAFVADNVVAPAADIETARQLDGPLQMVQFGNRNSALYLVALIALSACVVSVGALSRPREVAADRAVQLALAFIAYNVVFHYFYRANGSPFIFSTHTVFPVLFVVARLFSQSTARWRRSALAIATAAIIANNVSFSVFVRRALDLECSEQVGNVCLHWAATNEERLTKGTQEFLSSSDYPFEQGRVRFAARDFEGSVPYFNQALAMEKTHPLATLYLGAALLDLNRIDEAYAILEERAARDPRNRELSRLLAEVVRRKSAAP